MDYRGYPWFQERRGDAPSFTSEQERTIAALHRQITKLRDVKEAVHREQRALWVAMSSPDHLLDDSDDPVWTLKMQEMRNAQLAIGLMEIDELLETLREAIWCICDTK